MTPDTPTTATAAMSELLRKNPRPWSVWVSPNARQLVDATNAPISLNDICAAANATGTGDAIEAEQARWQNAIDEIVAKECPDRDGSGCDSGDPLDVTLTEIRQMINEKDDQQEEQRKSINRLIDNAKVIAAERDALRSELAAAREQHMELRKAVEDVLPYAIGGVQKKLSAALAPSQPTPDAGEKHDARVIKALRAAGGGGEG